MHRVHESSKNILHFIDNDFRRSSSTVILRISFSLTPTFLFTVYYVIIILLEHCLCMYVIRRLFCLLPEVLQATC